VAQVVERLPSKCEVLSSNPSTVKKNRYFNVFTAPSAFFMFPSLSHLKKTIFSKSEDHAYYLRDSDTILNITISLANVLSLI
jgi:hypothetical protein